MLAADPLRCSGGDMLMAPSDLHRAAAQPTVPATQPRVEWVVVPDHELVGRIGQGSYGEVWLARELKRCRRLPFEECVQLGLALSSALSHMHQRGLVHRDVKPSNILYVGGVPKLGDMGLVGEVGESASYVGTEGYIPPEGAGTPRADVFGLGKVLYEAGTGQDRLEFPLLPGGLGEGPAEARLVELNEVFLKACAPDPGQRYKTAEGVAR